MAVYLYATVEGLPQWWKPPPGGIGAEPVVAREIKDLFLIVSPLTTAFSRTPRTVAAHQEVVASLLDARAVVPFECGTVLAAAELDSWLASRLASLRAALGEVRGSVEMTVRLLRLDARAGTSESLEALAGRLVERAGLPRWFYRGDGTAAASVAFLVPRGEVQSFLARIAPVASHATGVAVVPTGPWAPYSFVPALTPAAASRSVWRAG